MIGLKSSPQESVIHLMAVSGFLVEFVSGPVVSGFTSAAAFIIASSQVKGLFGLHYKSDDFLSAWVQFFQHVQGTLLTDLCLGAVCITLLLLLRVRTSYTVKMIAYIMFSCS